MLLAKPVTFVATVDPARARTFYTDVVGLRFVRDDGFALLFDNVGVPLRVSRVEAFTPRPYTVLGWEVADIDATVAALADRGAVFQRYTFLEQDAAGIWSAPGGARVAWFLDPDGNVLSLSQGA
jgi:catechol 2,3-dioxygenase-like lactoylglutathione lyase family enzyme